LDPFTAEGEDLLLVVPYAGGEVGEDGQLVQVLIGGCAARAGHRQVSVEYGAGSPSDHTNVVFTIAPFPMLRSTDA